MDYTAIIIKDMLYHAKKSAWRINRLKEREPEEAANNAYYELLKLYGELRALSMLSLPHDERRTHKYFLRFHLQVERFYYKKVLNYKFTKV